MTQEIEPVFLRLPAVMKVTGLSKATIYRLEKNGLFPGRFKLSAQASAWKYDEINQWVMSRLRAEISDQR